VIFEQIATGGCQSYLVGCADPCARTLIDPELSQVRGRDACEAGHIPGACLR
jgi:hypothetical protein